MKTIKTLAPTAGEPSGGNTVAPVAKSTTTRRLPKKDHDFGQLCNSAAKNWKQEPGFALKYITQPQFEAMANQFNSTLGAKQKTAGDISPLAGDLGAADKRIDKGIAQVKLYLREKYEDKAEDYYASFGIERKGLSYKIPSDREKRLAALKLIVDAIEKEGFAEKKYGKEFWSGMYTQYEGLLTASTKTTGTVSNKVGDKNLLKEQLKDVLNSLVLLIMANYPKNYKAVLRNWGFQKERY